MIKLLFFGSSKFVFPIIEVLKRNFDLALVVTTEKQPIEPVISYCLANQIPNLSVTNLSDPTIRYTLDARRSILGVVADFGLIIPSEALNAFKYGILNLHPSLLPKYRGPTPVQTAISNGDKKTGVTIIKLDEEIDHGPILAQAQEPIFDNDTAETLYERLFKIGAQLLPQTINQYIKGKLKPSEQDHSKATFTKRLTRENGRFDINKPPTKEKLDRMIRAYYPWPGVWTRLPSRSHLVRGETSQGKIVKFLPGEKIQVEGKKPMSYKDFLNGYPEAKTWFSKLFSISLQNQKSQNCILLDSHVLVK